MPGPHTWGAVPYIGSFDSLYCFFCTRGTRTRSALDQMRRDVHEVIWHRAERAGRSFAHQLTHFRSAGNVRHFVPGNGRVTRRNIAHRHEAQQVASFDIEAGGKRWVTVRWNGFEFRLLDELELAGFAGRPIDAKPSLAGGASASLGAPRRDRPDPGGHAVGWLAG